MGAIRSCGRRWCEDVAVRMVLRTLLVMMLWEDVAVRYGAAELRETVLRTLLGEDDRAGVQ